MGSSVKKVVKKVTKPIKKVAKSDVGKAALIGAIGFGIPGTQIGGLFGRASFGGQATGLFGTKGIGPLLSRVNPFVPAGDDADPISLLDRFRSLGITGKLLSKPGLTIGAISAASGLLAAKDQKTEEEIAAMSQEERNEYVAKLRAAYTANLAGGFPGIGSVPYTMAAEGGIMMASSMGDEGDEISMRLFGKPVKDLDEFELIDFYEELQRLQEKFRGAQGGRVDYAEGSKDKSGIMMVSNEYNERLLESLFEQFLEEGFSEAEAARKAREAFENLPGLAKGGMPTGIMRTNAAGIKERDYRDEGGFVPVGIKEKADDVPAMLSKNEFVMTADAVRGAGNGSIEKGAQKMYDTMKELENRVA